MKGLAAGIMGGFSTERFRIPNSVSDEKRNPGCQTTHLAKAFAMVILWVARSEEMAEAQSVGAGA